MSTAIALAALLHACAPQVGPRTMTAIIHVESGGNAHAIHDNTSGLTYYPGSTARATRLASSLIDAGHSVDLGLSQINSMNLSGMGLSVGDMFNPCTNVRASSRILVQDYRRAVKRFGPGQVALRHAIGAYNTGSIYAGSSYISRVIAAASSRHDHTVELAADQVPRGLRIHAQTHRHHMHVAHSHPLAQAPRTYPLAAWARSAAFSIEAAAE
jgi:type IV secretion system protein VirB1